MLFAEFVIKEAKEKLKDTAGKISEAGREVSESRIKEYAKEKIDKINETGDTILAKLDEIKGMTPEQLSAQLKENIEKIKESGENAEGKEAAEKSEGLTDEEKAKIKEEVGWSDEIINAIGSWKEYEIYKNAGLVEAEIGGRKCLIRTDIDWDQKDIDGRTNRERVEEGKAPLDKNGRPLQLHHIGQHADSPLAELTFEEHRCGGNDTILHEKNKETEVHGPGNNWDSEREQYWKDRNAAEGGNNQ